MDDMDVIDKEVNFVNGSLNEALGSNQNPIPKDEEHHRTVSPQTKTEKKKNKPLQSQKRKPNQSQNLTKTTNTTKSKKIPPKAKGQKSTTSIMTSAKSAALKPKQAKATEKKDKADTFQEIHVDNEKPSWKGRGVKAGLRLLKPTVFNGVTFPSVKRFYTHLGGLSLSYAKDVKKKAVDEQELPVRGHVFYPDTALKETAMLYLHGGAYELGVLSATKRFASHLAKAINATVYVPHYRLAPQNPYPAGLDDCFDSYRQLVDRYGANNLFIAGDSAGAGLATSVLARARKFNLPMPKKLVLLSPWVDFSSTGESYRNRKRRDPIISSGWLNTALKRYTGTPALRSLDDEAIAAISPLNESLQQFPETMIQVGSEEILLSDAYALANKLMVGKVKGRLEVWDGLWHCWPLYTFLPESQAALEHIARFIGYQEGEAPVIEQQ